MYSVDKSNFKQYLIDFPHQISKAREIFASSDVNVNAEKITNVIVLGMGGSAISGDLLHDVYVDELKVPMTTVRGYAIPAYCSGNSLVLVFSYSGNTEETLAAARTAAGTGAQFVAITSGGELLKLAQENKWSLVQIPEGFPPRQAFGFLFVSGLLALNSAGLISVADNELNDLEHHCSTLVQRTNEQTAEASILCKDLAIRIKGKIPAVYGSTPLLSSIGKRWQNQFQENSKSMAFSNVLPEMNHNEIVGWEMESDSVNDFVVIFLEDQENHPRINARISLTKSIVRDRGVEVLEIYSEGNTRLERAVSLVVMGDWISYYLALLYEKDPIEILNIDYLKSELKKLS
jgi:glucose/mannose-6-phosphate isomerase